MSNQQNFENFWDDDDSDNELFKGNDLGNLDDFDQPSFPEDDFGDLPEVEEEGGISRTFIIAGGVLGVAFLGLMGLIGFLLLRDDGSVSASALTATAITLNNQRVETEVAGSQTAVVVQGNATATAEQILAATETAEAIQRVTATQQAVGTAIEQTKVQQDINATFTAVVVAQTLTAEAASPTPGTIALQIIDPDAGNAPVANVLVCVFLDDGDGQFDPAAGTTPLCLPVGQTPGTQSGGGTTQTTSTAVPSGTTPTATTATGGAGGTTSVPPLNPIFQTSTAAAGGNTGTGGINPIFQTSTAAASGGSTGTTGGQTGTTPTATQAPAQIPTTVTQTSPGSPPSPTPEASGFGDSYSAVPYVAPVGRSIDDPDGANQIAQEGGQGDEVVGQITTNEQGQLVISGLPPGQYWIKIADTTLQFEVTTEAQLITLEPSTGGPPIQVLIPGAVASPTPVSNDDGTIVPSPTRDSLIPTNTPLSPFDQTATAQFALTQGVTIPPSPDQLENTGLFSGDSDEVTGADLLILGLIGMVLVGVVLAARRLRAAA